MSVYAYIDTALDVVMTVLGIILIFKARGNTMKLFWGALSLLIGLIFIRDNFELIAHPGMPAASHGGAYSDLLIPGRMLEWIIPATACSLFPLLSLRPGFFTPARVLLFGIPVGATLTVGVCYMLFNGHITPLTNLGEVWANIGKVDVVVRLMIFLMSVAIPTLYFSVPLMLRYSHIRRRSTLTMKVFIWSMIICMSYYAVYMLAANYFLFSTINLLIECFCIAFSIAFLYYENPLSSHSANEDCVVEQQKSIPEILFCEISDHLAVDHPFVRADYRIADLAAAMNTKVSLVVDAIKCGGFTGFREYVGYLRVNRFKELASADRSKSIKELMNECGFTSRSSFYRLFSSYEEITPSDYIERLLRGE